MFGNTFTPNGKGSPVIEIQRLTSNKSTFDFLIPAGYNFIKINGSIRTNLTTGGATCKFYINNDSGNNYTGLIQWSGGKTEQTTPGAAFPFYFCNSDVSPVGWFSNFELTIPEYLSTIKHKDFQSRGMQAIAATPGAFYIYDAMGTWHSNNAINRVTIFANTGTFFKPGSCCVLSGY